MSVDTTIASAIAKIQSAIEQYNSQGTDPPGYLLNQLAELKLSTDTSGGIAQAVTVANLPLPLGAATDLTLQQVRDAIKAQIDIASTIWTDNSGNFYVKRDLVNEGTGAITVSFTDSLGNAVTPGAGLRPLASADKDAITDYYDVLTSATGYSIGDLLARVAVLDINSGTPSVTVIWLNLSLGTILSSSPISANIERANENVGARQIGNWLVTANLGTNDALNLSNLNTAIGTPITGAILPTGGVGWLGWLSAIWKMIGDRSNATKKYVPSDLDDTNGYYGFVSASGAYYIQKVTTNSIRYTVGTTGYTTAWTNRAAQTYDYFYSVTL